MEKVLKTKLQNTIPLCEERKESLQDKIATAQGVAAAKQIDVENFEFEEHSDIDKETKIRDNSSEIKTIKDIDHFRVTRKSAWTENWDAAVRAFSKTR